MRAEVEAILREMGDVVHDFDDAPEKRVSFRGGGRKGKGKCRPIKFDDRDLFEDQED